MTHPIHFRAGEATVFASEGQFTDAMPEVLIGAVDGPVGQAFANMMGQTAGHTRMFAIRACNQLVRPVTMMVPKVTIKSSAYVNLFGGVVQSAPKDLEYRTELLGALAFDDGLRADVIAGQRRRLADFGDARITRDLTAVIQSLS